MNDTERLKFYQETYEGDLRYKDQLLSSLSTFVGILTAIAGAAVYYWQHPPTSLPGPLTSFFYGSVGAAMASYLAGAAYLALVLRGQAYTYVAAPDAIEAWLTREVELSVGESDPFGAASQKLERMLIKQTAEIAGHNRSVNKRNSEWAYRGKLLTLLAAFFIVLSAVPYGMSP